MSWAAGAEVGPARREAAGGLCGPGRGWWRRRRLSNPGASAERAVFPARPARDSGRRPSEAELFPSPPPRAGRVFGTRRLTEDDRALVCLFNLARRQ